MNRFDIYTDSSANLTEEMMTKHGIKMVSYTCSIDGKDMECYEEDRPFAETAKIFYDAMGAGADTKTTLVNADKIINAVEHSLKNGKDVLFITISSQISGTYSQAKLVSEEMMAKYPERKMIVCDSFNAGLGEGLFAAKAATLRDMGESVESCAKWIDSHKLNMNSIFTVSDLKYLRRGGRISTTLAIAGTILNIKPILKADANGKISFAGTERGRKKAISHLVESFMETVKDIENQTIAITHADCEADALALAQMIKDKGAKDVVINWFDICSGAHVGPGSLALFYLGKERGKTAEEKPTAKFGLPARANN